MIPTVGANQNKHLRGKKGNRSERPDFYYSEGEKERARGAGINFLLFCAMMFVALTAYVGTLPPVREAIGLPPMRVANVTPGRSKTRVRVTEVMSSNKHTLTDEYGKFPDWVEIENTGDEPEDITGFVLTDRVHRDKFIFPETIIAPHERIIVFASGKFSNEVNLHASFKVSAGGEGLFLKNAEGELVEMLGVVALKSDTSYTLVDDKFVISSEPTPGYENSEQGRAAFVADMTRDSDAIIITEIMGSNKGFLTDSDGDDPDWIEIYNKKDYAVDLSRFALSDKPEKPVRWKFPPGTVIDPHGVMVIFASGKNKKAGGELHTNFKVAANHGVVILSSVFGEVLECVEYDNLRPNMTYKRNGNSSEWSYTDMPTPRSLN